MSHKVLAIAGSPRRRGNSETLLDRALAGVAEAAPDAEVHKLVLNEMKFVPCQNCGFCSKKGFCRFAEGDDMGEVYGLLDASDRFVVASPVFFGTISAQLKAMIDRCQAIWARKYLLKQSHENADRQALFMACGGFKQDRFRHCARQVMEAWCVCLDIKLADELFYTSIDARGEIEQHPTALDDAFAAGKKLVT